MARSASGSGKLLAALLIVLAGAGGFNYYRNLRAEKQVPRPYAGYSDAEIEALVEAYRSEAEAFDARLRAAREEGVDTSAGALLGERAAAFERARRHGERIRALAGEAAGRESVVKGLRREQAIREHLARGWRLHLERLVSLQSSLSSSRARSSPR